MNLSNSDTKRKSHEPESSRQIAANSNSILN